MTTNATEAPGTKITAPRVDPLAGLDVRHNSEVLVVETCIGDDDQQLHDVLLDGDAVGSAMLRDDADHFVTDIERRIRHAQLVRGIRMLATFIEERPTLAIESVTANIDLYGEPADNRARLADIAEQLGEYEAALDKRANVRLRREFSATVRIRAFGYQAALSEPVVAPKYELPDLPGRNLAAETPIS
jgi:hypothetical protein